MSDDLAAFLLACLYEAQGRAEAQLGVDNERAKFELADIDAKRRIVELFNHSAVTGLQNRVEHGEVVTTEYVRCACGWEQDVLSYQDWEDLFGAHLADLGLSSEPDDQVLRLLALPYAGRDGWRDEWRPE